MATLTATGNGVEMPGAGAGGAEREPASDGAVASIAAGAARIHTRRNFVGPRADAPR